MTDPRPPVFGPPPDGEAIASLAKQALASIPARLARHVTDIGFMVEERADEETLADLGLESAWELSGLYRGIPLTERTLSDPVRPPDMIFLFREAILLEWIETGEDLYKLVRSVVIHEVAHHFGFSDREIEALERETDAG